MIAESEIDDAHTRGGRSWPGIEISAIQFGDMARELGVEEQGLRSWAEDFYLACAAAHGNEDAVEIIDERYVRTLAGRIRRLGAAPSAVPDVLQAIRERLFTGARARIRAYDASGPLDRWIKVVGIRTAVDLYRAQSPVDRMTAAVPASLAGALSDLATDLTKGQYRAEVQEVLKSGILTLAARDRVVLRLHLVEGLSLEKIAAAHGVHRVTVARWVWNAGEMLLDHLRRHFKDRYGMVPSECDSLAHLVRSQLSLDLQRVLATP
jgi:RNA polymerase sigma-70 factor (ECF subfamily)